MSRDPAGPRFHRPREDRQVRGLLPRPRRRAAGRGRFRRRDARAARHRRASPVPQAARHDRAAVQRHCRGRGRVRALRCRDRLRHHRSQPRATWARYRRCPASTPALRRITAEHGALLIVDEVMTGFRVSRIRLVRAGSGGGRPVHVRQGDERRTAGRGVRRPGRGHVAGWLRSGPVYQAGTLSGNPVAVAAGLATLRAARRRRLCRAGRQRRPAGRADRRGADRGGCARTRCSAPATCSACSSPRAGHRLRRARGASETWRFPAFFHAMLDARRLPAAAAPSRPGSSRPRSTTTRSTGSPPRCPAPPARAAAQDRRSRRDRDDDRARDAPRRGAQPGEDPLRPVARLPPVRAGPGAGPGGGRLAGRTATSPTWSPRRWSAPRRPLRRSRRTTAWPSTPTIELIESTNVFRATGLGPATGRCATRATGGTCATHVTPSWGEPYAGHRRADDAPRCTAPGRRRGPRRRCCVSHQLPVGRCAAR